ncbi:MAG: adenylosuccinate lyase [Flavobacteriales bacterium]|jgi:hypothetical protein|uniref:adenylosuccinate lyase n=1 Tax=Candidatus Ulvibacter alkanivorans TaxID=2267620 RepID=UPI000DF1B523|nr:adenylosuccinate lyase [Candidatus Ulvibacter alkanivorans]MCH2488840.1 adenylosuccinate lyase [Flavobacteriales bacterium]
MASETLLEKLQYTKAYRKTRLDVAHWVLDHPETFSELLNYCYKTEADISYKATWILEFVCAEKLDLLYPYLDKFFENLPKISRDQALRPLAKICEMMAVHYYKEKDEEILKQLTKEHKQTMVSCCFDWLITDQKVACKVYAMQCLYYLGTEFGWIHPELKAIINENIHSGSPAYRARGRFILKKLNR